MAPSAPSSDGSVDKPPERGPGNSTTSLDSPANPQRNGKFPALPSVPPPPDDDEMSVMGMMVNTDLQARARPQARRGAKRPLARPRVWTACDERKKMIVDKRETECSLDPLAFHRSDDAFSASPSAPAPSPLMGLGMDLTDPQALSVLSRLCPACKEIFLDKPEDRHRLDPLASIQRNGEFSMSPPELVPGQSSGDGKPVLGLGRELPDSPVQALGGTKQMPSAQKRGCLGCDVAKKVMHRMRGWLHRHYEKLAMEVACFGATDGGGDLLEECEKLARLQGAQEPSSSAADGADVFYEKIMLYEQCILLDSAEFMRLLVPEAGSSAASGGGVLGGCHGGLDHEAMHKLVNQTGEQMQDIVKMVIPQLFSKENVYVLLMKFVGQYPKWLEDNKGKLKKEEYEQYEKQLDLMVNLTVVYDDDPENFSKITKIMSKIAECGPPPSDIIEDTVPGFDPSTLLQLFPGMVDLLRNVLFVHTNPLSK